MKPTIANRVRFEVLWHKAQKTRNVERMESLLQPKWFPFWWQILAYDIRAIGTPRWSTAFAAVERILAEKAMIELPPERPSERAMRMAEKEFNSEH